MTADKIASVTGGFDGYSRQTVEKARMLYALGAYFARGVSREEEFARIAQQASMAGAPVAGETIAGWYAKHSPDGFDWDAMRLQWDGTALGRVEWTPESIYETGTRLFAMADQLTAVCLASIRVRQLYDKGGNPVDCLFTEDGQQVPVGGLRPDKFRDALNGIVAGSELMMKQGLQLEGLRDKLGEETRLVAQLAARILEAIEATPEQKRQLLQMQQVGLPEAHDGEESIDVTGGER